MNDTCTQIRRSWVISCKDKFLCFRKKSWLLLYQIMALHVYYQLILEGVCISQITRLHLVIVVWGNMIGWMVNFGFGLRNTGLLLFHLVTIYDQLSRNGTSTPTQDWSPLQMSESIKIETARDFYIFFWEKNIKSLSNKKID